ncbi:hypothetical protein ACQPX6_25325 [Actinomycetospora sp. CA-101289]|uniref:hypothetical protein n=1 Tax=Actinomycetospora sp. CA-101289 TaxID=3239893 RepID=UPI003D9A0B09
MVQYTGHPAKTHVVGHPSYQDWLDRRSDVMDQRKRKPGQYLVIGNVRADKGAAEVDSIVAGLADGEELVIAGRLDRQQREHPHRLTVLGASGRSLSDDVLAEAVAGADVVLAPYAHVTVSGSTILALTCSRPVAAYDGESMRELLPKAWLCNPEPSALLETARALSGRCPEDIGPSLDEVSYTSWERALKEFD